MILLAFLLERMSDKRNYRSSFQIRSLTDFQRLEYKEYDCCLDRLLDTQEEIVWQLKSLCPKWGLSMAVA